MTQNKRIDILRTDSESIKNTKIVAKAIKVEQLLLLQGNFETKAQSLAMRQL